MRDTLDVALAGRAARDGSVVLVTADLGSFRTFRSVAPERFFNVGVSEPLSVSFAAGLASEGWAVFLYTVAGFTLYRAWEQLKFAVGYWRQDVTVIGTGFGWRYHMIGHGHRTPDDIAMARLIPNMRVLAPATDDSLRAMVAEGTGGPRFIRLGEGLRVSKAPPRDGSVVVAALGDTWVRCIDPVTELRTKGADLGLVAIEDFDDPHLVELTSSRTPIIVVEDHVSIGGLADRLRSLGGNVVAHHHLPINVSRITDTEEDLLAAYGFRTCDLTTWLAKVLGVVGQGETG
jgi:transketolase